MWKKLLMTAAALLFALGANFELACRYEGISGTYSPFEAGRCQLAAAEAASEIRRTDGSVTLPVCRYVLHWRGADFDGEGLTDAILRQAPDVAAVCGVYVNGMRLGTVADGAELTDALRQDLAEELPAGAVKAMYTQEIDTRLCWSCASRVCDAAEMVGFVRALCPVVFIGADGGRVAA